MYVWIWRRLPGGVPGKLLGCVLLFLGVAALLFYVVFPYVDTALPFNDVTVGGGASVSPAPTQVTPTPGRTP